MSFETALSGLNAAAADLDVTGNNIANSQTTAFKYSRAEFADIFASSALGVSQNAIGQGVRLSAVAQQHTQGQFSFTGNNLDLAVNGSGFFRMSDGGQIVYSRAGAFHLDRDGYVTDASGRRLTGRNVDADGNIGGALTELQINTGDVQPRATSQVGITANLTSASDQTVFPPGSAPDIVDASTYNFSTTSTVYDSQGQSHLMSLYFVKTGSNQWESYTVLDGDAANMEGPTVLSFDGDGVLAGVTPQDPTAPANSDTYTFPAPGGANAPVITVDYNEITQFGTPFSVTRLSPDGYPAGQFAGLSVEANGIVTARYSNGQTTTLGQVVLAQFPSPQNLQQVGDTSWVETFASGAPITDAPGNSGLGALQSGSLEQSNVNVSEQLVKMITAQRSYQANAKMISTQDQITQEILNIR
jgi:flagellar hook protein FlgE